MEIPQDFLSAISEMALAIIGFSGIVTILGQGKRTWSPEVLLRLRTQVEPAACAMFGAMLPATLNSFVTDPETLWRLSNALLGLFILLAFITFSTRVGTAKLVLSQKILTVISALVLISIFLSAVNIFGFHQLTYFLGLWLGLIVGVHNFGLLLFGSEHE